MRMTLRAIADDGHVFAFDQGQVAIFIVKNFHFFLPKFEFEWGTLYGYLLKL
jgi:hypothetical protein